MADNLSQDLASLRIERASEKNPQIQQNRRTLLFGAIGLVLAVGLGFAAWTLISARVFKPEVAFTEIRLLSPAQSSVKVTSTGYVVPQTSSKVGAKLLGRVAEVKVKQGSNVKAGDVLVQLDDAEQRVAIAGARARAAAARAQLTETKRMFERERDLAAQGASARSVAEDLENKMKSFEESVKAADAEVDALVVTLRYATITAPIDGVVISEPVEVGELVGPQNAEPILELADFSTLMVETDVPETRMDLVRAGSPAEIVLDAYPTRRFRGVVAEISPRVNRAKATVIVKVKFADESDGVLPDMAARVSFLAKELDSASMKEPPKLFAPSSAVVERSGAKVVFTVDDGKVRMIPVTVKGPMEGGFELASGPASGTKVVASPPPSLGDGAQVKERPRK